MINLGLSFKVTWDLKKKKRFCSVVMHFHMNDGVNVTEYTKPMVWLTLSFVSVKATAVFACINRGIFSYH